MELREKKADMRVTLVGLPATGAAVRVENVGHLSKLRDPCKRVCDYLLVLEANGDTSVLFIELKKTQTPSDRPREQLRRSLPILKYLLSVCEVERGTTLKSVSVRYAIVFERVSEKLDKQRIRADPKTRWVRLFFVGGFRRGSMGFCERHGKSYLTRRRRGEEGGGGGSVTGGTTGGTIPSA